MDSKPIAQADSYGIGILRDQVEMILLKEAERLHVPIYWSHKLIDIDFDRKICTFEAKDDDHQEPSLVTIKVGESLVGADGNFSRVRRHCELKCLLEVDEKDWGFRMRHINVPSPPASHKLPPTVDGNVHYVVPDGYICQRPDGGWWISWAVDDESDEFLRSTDASSQNIKMLREMCQRKAA